ncbi:MAG: hypothetical protein IGS39_03285 [Calothrix sp. C42_A2020_038]|nr:hypothetical protein [Calothrix sp. C42_A2020_038]
MHDKQQDIEERNEGKLSCSVLKTNKAGDSLVEFNQMFNDLGAALGFSKKKNFFAKPLDE